MKTNTEFVVDLMEWSDCGALIQPFVIEALWEYSMRVTTQPPPETNGLINWDVWVKCAEEVVEKISRRHATAS